MNNRSILRMLGKVRTTWMVSSIFRYCLCMLCFWGSYDLIPAQSPFNIIIDHGGPTGQSINYVCMANEDSIFVIGDYIDSARTNIWPQLSTFDYKGNQLHQKLLRDSSYAKDFIVAKSIPKKIANNRYLYVANRAVNDTGYFHSYIMELDVQSGNIIKSRAIAYNDYGYFMYMNYYDGQIINMVFYQLKKDEKQDIVILELDTNFNIIHSIRFPMEKYHVPFYIEKTKHGNYEIIGDKRIFGETRSEDSLFIFHAKINPLGEILDYDLHDFGHQMFFGTLTTYTVVKSPYNDWVITAKESITNIDCTNCARNNVFPYVFSYSEDFDTLLWQRAFFTKPYYEYPDNSITTMISTENETGYVTIGSKTYRDSTRSYGNGWIFKTSIDGDSLWSHTYLPASKTVDDLVISVTFKNIIESPNGGFIVTGHYSDGDLRKFRAILLYIDEDGCLIPGCDTPVNTQDIIKGKSIAFKIYPNPAQDFIYLLSYKSSSKMHEMRLSSLTGKILEQYYIQPEKNGQYILSLPSHLSGMYLLHILDSDGRLVQTEKVVIN